MGNSFSLVKVIAIIVVILILITMGIFVFSNTETFVKGTSDKIKLTDSSEFNSKWLSYEGKQAGSKLKAMAEKLISNAETNKEIPSMLPDLIYQATESGQIVNIRSTVKGKEKNNIEGFQKLKEDLNSRHTYWVKLVYSEKTNLVSGIIIQYSQKDKIEFTPDET